ncbi:MAG TPA: BamA/TamA family outer membrane protein [Salinimicrobium sp.]|nr:BamA/TamA family outer membrane protein [Salinimicrobium sp.]
MKKTRVIQICFGMLFLSLLLSCNAKKFIPEEELLYTGATVEITAEDENAPIKELEKELEPVLGPEPNTKFLGMRPGLYFHYKAQKENPGFINKWLNKKFGEEPVYASDIELQRVEDVIANRLENSGYFYSDVASQMNEFEKKKIASAFYQVNLADPYLMANDYYEIEAEDSLLIYQEIKNLPPSTFITPKMRFNLAAFKAERERIDAELKSVGYYNFNPELLIFEADTNQYNNKKFDLFLRLKKDVPEEAIVPYKIKEVNVYPYYVIESDTVARDTVRLENKNFIQNDNFFKPKRLEPYILIDEGEFYNPEASRNTSRRLSSIGAYKFVNIRYDEIDSLATDSISYLEANIFLSPLPRRAIRAELQAVTKSNDFMGPNLALTYSNRNFFHGGEVFNLGAQFGYEWQSGSGRSLSSIHLGAKADLIFPRIIFPIRINTDTELFKYSIPKTKMSLGLDYLSRTELFRMHSVTALYGYTWRSNRYITHDFSPVSVSYINLGRVTSDFTEILEDNPYLENSFRQQFIGGILYSFTYNGMIDTEDKHQFFLNSNLDVAGNTLSLFSKKSENGEPGKVFDLEYAQYAKLDVDLRYHFNMGNDQVIATRLFAGYGMPYGNSEVMPFTKQYFSGGPYSVRAFHIRALGPGSYNPEESGGAYFDQAGNIRLEANVEYRFPLVAFLKGAVFADAGNVWYSSDVVYLPGGEFDSDFITELGIGIGVGVRLDIQGFVLRLDLAAPMHTPWLDKGERWNFNFGSPVLNLGIGYPF